MTNLLNTERPPLFCPGCSHERVVHGLNHALEMMDLAGERVAIISDIGCSGLFDTFFNTHAFHGLHGRALTYAAGLKMAKPELTVIVVMGDGGLGIGGAHVLSSCRRNMDITLLVLNNFNYGMTGGQCSATTPGEAHTASGFLNQLEVPLDICRVALAAGAVYVDREMATGKILVDRIAKAIRYPGFSIMDIWGICPGRYLKKNRITLKELEEEMGRKETSRGPVIGNEREEYTAHYRRLVSKVRSADKMQRITPIYKAPILDRTEVLLLGAAGQYINSIGEILCLAGMSGGLHVTQKNDYPITVLRGHSVSEVVFDLKPVGYTGISNPAALLCVAPEGIGRRKDIFGTLQRDTLIIKDNNLVIPDTGARVVGIDFSGLKVKKTMWALAALAVLAEEGTLLTTEMLESGLALRYHGEMYDEAMDVLTRATGQAIIPGDKRRNRSKTS